MQRNDRIGRQLKLKDLHTFRTVVQHRSMARAAAELALTPPAITKVIGDMEHLFGVRLLERTPQGVTPTAYGEALLKGSVNLFDDLKQTIEQIEILADPTVGEVRVGTMDPSLGSILPVVLDRVTRQHPKMVFHVTHANVSDELRSALRTRAIDVVVNRLDMEPEEDFDKEALFNDPVVVVTGRDNPQFRGRSVTLAQLVDATWCVPHETHAIGALFRQAFRAQGLALPNVSITCATMQLQPAMAETGRFLTVVPASYLRFRSDKDTLRIVPVDLHVSVPPIGIATLKHRMVSPATKLFIECARTVAKEVMLSAPKGKSAIIGAAEAKSKATSKHKTPHQEK
jgi:DNA-binding transcriptional LysR family regulator